MFVFLNFCQRFNKCNSFLPLDARSLQNRIQQTLKRQSLCSSMQSWVSQLKRSLWDFYWYPKQMRSRKLPKTIALKQNRNPLLWLCFIATSSFSGNCCLKMNLKWTVLTCSWSVSLCHLHLLIIIIMPSANALHLSSSSSHSFINTLMLV